MARLRSKDASWVFSGLGYVTALLQQQQQQQQSLVTWSLGLQQSETIGITPEVSTM